MKSRTEADTTYKLAYASAEQDEMNEADLGDITLVSDN